MTLRHAEIELRGSRNPLDQKDANDVARILRRRFSRGSQDIPLPGHVEPTGPLQQTAQEYGRQLFTPELTLESVLVTRFWREMIEEALKGTEVSPPEIPDCNRTTSELALLKSLNRGMVYDPKLPYSIIAQISPDRVRGVLMESSPIIDQNQAPGWRDVELTLDIPNADITEQDVADLLKSQGRQGQRFSTYFWASKMSWFLTGHFFDEKSWGVRLLGSQQDNQTVIAYSRENGECGIAWPVPANFNHPSIGARTEGV